MAHWAHVDEQAGPKWSWRYDSTEEPMKLGVSAHVGRVEVEFYRERADTVV